MRLGVLAPFDQTGYGVVACELVSHLLDEKFPVWIIPQTMSPPDSLRDKLRSRINRQIGFYDTLLVIANPKVLEQVKPLSQYRIGYTYWETDRLPSHLRAGLFSVDELWAPSSHCHRLYLDAEVDRKDLKLIPQGIDCSIFSPDGEKAKLRGRGFKFLSIGEFSVRKGIPDLLIPAFRDEFSHREASLHLRTYSPSIRRDQICREVERISGKAEIHLLPYIPREELPSIYRGADAYVLPSRAEGFCNTLSESMACGTVCVAPDWGGHRDYLDSTNGFVIPIRGLEPVRGMDTAWYPEYLKWAKITVEDVRRTLRSCFDGKATFRWRREKAVKDMKKFDWNIIVKKIIDRLGEIEYG